MHRQEWRRHWPLAILLTFYIIAAILYALLTPAWQAPDEPAHYNYVRQLAAGNWPVMEAADYDQAHQGSVISERFADETDLQHAFSYEDYQPPLYYILETPLYWLGNGRLSVLRFGSIIWGAGLVMMIYGAGLLLFQRRDLALTAAAFGAFIPQHLAITAAVNNDSLSDFSIAALLLALLCWLYFRQDHWLFVAAAALAVGLLTKPTSYILLPLLGLWLCWLYWGEWRALIGSGLRLFLIPFLAGLPWWLRNLAVYGGIDFMGVQRHNLVVVGQPRTAEWIATRGGWETAAAFLQTTFRSFWGQFGWMSVPMPPRIYTLLMLFCLIIIGGGVVRFWFDNPLRKTISKKQRTLRSNLIWLLGGTIVMNLVMYLGYNISYVQHQGRYLFASLLPLAIISTWSLAGWELVLDYFWGAKWANRLMTLLPVAVATLLFLLDIIALYRFIMPALIPNG